jgi:error-prone DNA polymerase
VGCTIESGASPEEDAAVRVGLGYVLGVRADEIAALVEARREGGPFRSLEDLASRAGAGRAALDTLAWSGACDELAGDRRTALWRLGVAAPGRKLARDGSAVQLALPLDLPAPPKLRRLQAWDEMIADYATTGISVDAHPVGLLRESLAARGAVSSLGLESLRHRQAVQIGGLVVARQRPGTAKGVAFILLEDELGTVNLVVPPAIYERDRLAVRSEPLVMAEGRVERFASAGGAINVVVDRLRALEAPGHLAAEVKELGKNFAIVGGEHEGEEQQLAAAAGGGGGGDFRAVAPPVLSFTSGRQR